METFGSETRKARKQHTCFWCGDPIEANTLYCRRVCCEDWIEEIKVHPECREAWHKGIQKDYFYYSEEVGFAEHNRGCICEKGRCECDKSKV